MSMKLTEAAYRQLIAEDLGWLDQQPDTLEADHIRQILKDTIRFYYPAHPTTDTVRVMVSRLQEFLATHHERVGQYALLAVDYAEFMALLDVLTLTEGVREPGQPVKPVKPVKPVAPPNITLTEGERPSR